jgi:hypothetical protein
MYCICLLIVTTINWFFNCCRKRTKKSNAQVGRKKANKCAGGDEAVTPRTRRAMAREAAAKARREAKKAELKAAAAREAAQTTVREEIEATRNELSAIHAQEDVLDMMPLEVHVQETTTARRYAIESTCSSCPYVYYCIHDFSCFE